MTSGPSGPVVLSFGEPARWTPLPTFPLLGFHRWFPAPSAWSVEGPDLCDALSGLGSHSKPVGWERLFWGVVQRSRHPIAVFDSRGFHLAVNAATCEFFGVSRDEFGQSRLGRLLTPAERSTLEDEWRQLWAKGDLSGVRIFTRADSSNVRLEYAARTAVVDGQRVAVVVIIRQERAHELSSAGQAGELTRREREVVSLVSLGLTSSEIAEKLWISETTVRTHVRNSMEKLGAKTRAHLVAIALADGQIAALPPTPAPAHHREPVCRSLLCRRRVVPLGPIAVSTGPRALPGVARLVRPGDLSAGRAV